MPRYYICITPFFPSSDSFRGPFIFDQVKAIERNSDFKVIVLKPCPFYHKETDYEFEGVKVYRFTDYNLPSNLWPNTLTDAGSVHSMFRKLAAIGVDIDDIAVAHGHVTRFGVWLNALKRRNPHIKSVLQHHGFDVMTLTDGRLADFQFHKRHCIRYGVGICNDVDINIGVSRHTLGYVKAVPGLRLKNEYVLYNGVDTALFRPDTHPKKHEGIFTIGCVGNFWELKDQITLVKAVHQVLKQGVTGLRTIFVGTGYTRCQCEDYIKANNIAEHFEFIDSIPHEKLPDFYRSLDLFVLPSYWEAFGCVYTEAYACGVPFIGVKDQGIDEIIEPADKERWLIDKGDYAKLAEMILRSIESPSDMPALGTPIDINVLVSDFLKKLESLC